jgi:outer membrane receptor for ferrienterochelin and colicin
MHCWLLLSLLAAGQFAQPSTGELRLAITDASQLPLAASVEIVNEANQVHETIDADRAGVAVAKQLPFATYRVTVTRAGFEPLVTSVEIRTALPTPLRVTLNLAPLQAQVTVTPPETLLDPGRAGASQRIGRDTIQTRPMALPGRSLPDLVNTQPGWLLEANGVLHPRGSEYQTQYVIDGLPLTDNRSPAFAPELDADDVHGMNVLTGGYPAEYGRKLGGVIEVVTEGAVPHGFHGSAAGALGSFNTKDGDANVGYSSPRTSVNVIAGGADTDRYLDPPVEENFTNHGSTAHAAVHLDHDVTDADRFGVIARYGASRFQVPNERVQQEAGQEQTRENRESAAQVSYQHVASSNVLVDVRAMARDLSARLDSNAASTPIAARQDRGLRDAYVKGAVSVHAGAHEWKFGGDLVAGTVREQFAYQITDPDQFDPETLQSFAFDDQRPDREQSLFVQDRIQWNHWTLNAGVRWDHYHVVADESAISPRVSAAWSWPERDLVVRASYDRAFQTPAVENLLLASSPEVDAVTDAVLRLPVPPSSGDFYEAGATKGLFGVLRLDGAFFYRSMTNFADDDVFLNTGVSFPIAFSHAVIKGAEIKIDLPHWRKLSASASYALMKGTGELPIAGGLFLGQDSSSALTSTSAFPVSQDQRHTVRGRASWQVHPSAWVAMATTYGSGLPTEFDGDPKDALEQYGARIIERVDFEEGRVRPNFTLDASTGVTLLKRSTHRLQVQADVRNLTNQLNVINFAGLFSGTAIAAPRSFALRVTTIF